MPLVLLSPVAPAHADAVQRLASDPAVTATTNLPEPYPEGGAASWIEFIAPRHAAGVEYAFAILAERGEAGSELVGMCGLVMPDGSGAHADAPAVMGYWIGADYWGRGYATAACELLTAFAFAETAVTVIDAYTLVENGASRRVLEKAGAVLVGIVPNIYPKWRPERLMAHYRLRR
jgi:[ribosomal protein S5]-alanine N-acetyltransferase